jgi:hypothetical protein
MPQATITEHDDERRFHTLRFTPAEWPVLLEDRSFLDEPDNDFAPRRLMGLPVEIVPDHRQG